MYKYGKQSFIELMTPYGFVSDKHMNYLEEVTNLKLTEIDDILRIHLNNTINPAEYFDKSGKPCNKEDAYYIWVSTGLKDVYKDDYLYIAFAKSKRTGDVYESDYFCYFVSPKHILERNITKYIEDSIKNNDEQLAFLEEIYNMLLIKSNWAALPEYKVLSELLKISEARINNDRINGYKERNCIYNNDESKLAYNPGLINIYGSDIVIIATLDENKNIINRKIAQSKTQLKQDGFAVTEVAPISFYKSRKDLIFSATAEDFDLDDFGRLRHIIEHRKERFPESVKCLTEDELFNKIRASLEFDLKMTARNPYWAAPFYNVKQNEIQYLLPLFTGSLSDNPILAMVIGKGEHYYEVRTVLPLKRAYANAACLASPPSAWLGTEI